MPTPKARPSDIDPTRSITLRRSFSQSLGTIFGALRKEITALIVTEDAFGLKPPADPFTANMRWKYKSQTEAAEEFDRWLNTKISGTILSDAQKVKWRKFIRKGFEKGASRAFDDTNVARKTAALDRLRGAGFVEGKREQFLRQALGKSTAVEKLKMLESRALSDVKGLTEDLRTKGKRTIIDGLTRGLSPRDIAARLTKQLKISKGRAETIAFTELVRAHAEGQLETKEQLGVQSVGVAIEWSTATDACSLCAPLRGIVLKISEARGMLPRHPRCRCAWLPANVGEDEAEKKTQKRGKYKIDKAIEQSQKREEKGRENQTDWGPNKDIDRKRPKQEVPTTNQPSACLCAVSIFSTLLKRLESDG